MILFKMEVILDTSVISAFVKIKRFGLLRKILEKNIVLIPDTVFREIICPEALFALAFSGDELNSVKWIRVEEVDVSDIENNLGDGEKGVIKLAKQKNAVAVIDDSRARKKAFECGLRVTGTFGLLSAALEKRAISKSELKEILSDLKVKDGFRISEDLTNKILGEIP